MAKILSFLQRLEKPDSCEALLRPHVEHLYHLGYRLTGNRDDAEDLVQELLTKLYPRREELAGLEHLRAWLSRSLYNLFIDGTRRAARTPSADEDITEYELPADSAQGPEAETARSQADRKLWAALDQLSPEHRSVLILHDMEGYGLGELELMLETPVGTLKSRLHRARNRMRELLEKMEPSAPSERYTEQRTMP